MALFPPLDASTEEVIRELRPLRNDFSIAVHSLDNAFAVGAIIRVAHSFLVREIIVIGSAPYYEKASMGMEKYETITRVEDDDAFFAHVSGRPVWGVEKELATVGLYDAPAFPKDVVFVLGSERKGLSKEFAARCNEVAAIPMYGVNNSFPVAIAAGIVMSEWARRRYSRAVVSAK